MIRRQLLVPVLALAVLLPVSLASAQQRALATTESLAVNQEKTFAPGYAVGDILIGNPKIADYKVLGGRRELMLFGRSTGTTTLTIWDQRRVKRHQVVIVVSEPVNPEAERELKALLQDFPSVQVRTLAGSHVLTGAVSSQDDLAAIEKIASAAKVRNLVRFTPPLGGPGATPMMPTPTIPAPVQPTPGPASPSKLAPRPTPAEPAAPQPVVESVPAGPAIEYEIELLEASVSFRSGSYATGIEPSGRRLYIGKVTAPLGTDGEVFIGGRSLAGTANDPKKASKPKSGGDQTDQGIRLTLRPQAPDSMGRFKTGILVQTNLPIASDTYDPTMWRRARWEFSSVAGEPFGITGADLLASPDTSNQRTGSSVGSAASNVSRIPGVSGIAGTEFVPVFGSLFGSSKYKQKQTQLMVVIRTRLVPAGGR